MSMLDRFESVVLFRVTHGFILLLLFGGIAFLFFWLTDYARTQRSEPGAVSAFVVGRQIHSNPDRPSRAGAKAVSPEEMLRGQIDTLIREFDPTEYDREQLWKQTQEWLDVVPSGERMAFLGELRTMVRNFEQRDRGAAAYAFVRLTIERGKARSVWKQEMASKSQQLLPVCLGVLILISVCSLILVLLRIERNTRPPSREAGLSASPWRRVG